MYKIKSLCLLFSGLFVSSAVASTVSVSSEEELWQATQNAQAGDTILVAPGTYTGDTGMSGDPGDLPNGTGLFWIGADGTAANPIVLAAADPSNKPILQGSDISSGYVLHITGDFVVIKNLILRQADKGIVFDNSSNSILEDCEIYNSGAELVHIRDASSNVVISRNHIHGSGNGGNGSIGEGLYIGTDQARWGADDLDESYWGDLAVSEAYGGYDWRVHNTQVMCNYISGGISAELMDIKEGTQYTVVQNNMLVGDSIGLKAGAASYDDSFIDLKGVKATISGNSFYTGGNNITKFVAEVERRYDHVPDTLTTDGYASPWCDTGDADNNVCTESDNSLVQTSVDPRDAGCVEYFPLDLTTSAESFSASASVLQISDYNWTADALTISLNQGFHGVVYLLDAQGKHIAAQKVSTEESSEFQVNLYSPMAPGVYWVRLNNGHSLQVKPLLLK